MSRRQRADINYATEVECFYQQFDAAMVGLRLSNAARACSLQLEMHVELGNQIRELLRRDFNPVTFLAMKKSYEQWIDVSNQIVGRLA